MSVIRTLTSQIIGLVTAQLEAKFSEQIKAIILEHVEARVTGELMKVREEMTQMRSEKQYFQSLNR